MTQRGVRPPEAAADYVERDCANPACPRTAWIPPGAEQAAQDAGTPFMPVCSMPCAMVVSKFIGDAPKVIMDNAPSLGHVIDRMWAYVAVDDEGEGIIGMPIPGLGTTPLVGADADRMLSLRPYAQQAATLSGRAVKLVRFETRVVVEELRPDTNRRR